MNIDTLRSFLTVAELGSLSRAAERIRLSQSTLTRQMQTLETELGARLFERGHAGVGLTSAGHTFVAALRPVLSELDSAIHLVRTQARGHHATLRIGYIQSAAAEYLNPAIASFRKQYPEIKLKLFDLAPGAQLAQLRKGELDVALFGNADPSLTGEFFLRKVAALPVAVAASENCRVAELERIRISDLRDESFIGAKDEDLPGYNSWLAKLCRKAKFKPRIVEEADSLSHSLSLVVSENAVTLIPAIAKRQASPGVIIQILDEPQVRWELSVLWQRGKTPPAISSLVELLTVKKTQATPRGF